MASETTIIQNGILSGGWGNSASNYAAELSRINSDLTDPTKNLSQQDRLNLMSYAQTLTGQARGAGLDIGTGQAGVTATGGAAVGAGDSGRPPGISDADWEQLQGYRDNPTGSTATPEQQAAIAGGDGSGSPLDWLKSQLGNVGLVVMGVVVVAVALVAATKTNQKMVIQAVKGAVT